MRQAGQHGAFGRAKRRQCLAKVGLGRGLKAIGTPTQVNLVHVELQHLVFAELGFDLEGQQCFLELARERARAVQKESARHLLRDGGATLHAPAGSNRRYGPCQADGVHTTMVVKARVFHRQQAVFHELGDLVNALVDASLAAKAAHLHAIGGVHAQRLLRLVVGQRAGVGQLRKYHCHGDN